MQECFSIRHQSVIKASECDYAEHDGFLLCLVCDEPVFLRKSHVRNGHKVVSALIHHKDSKFASTCELRSVVNREVLHRQSIRQHNQTLAKLELYMWKLLKTNACVELKHWSNMLCDCKSKADTFKGLCGWNDEILTRDLDTIWKCYEKIAEGLRTGDNGLKDISPERAKAIEQLCQHNNNVYWHRHINISWQAYKLLTTSHHMYPIRERLYGVLCYPRYMNANGITVGRWIREFDDTNCRYIAHLISGIQYICLTVDWQSLL